MIYVIGLSLIVGLLGLYYLFKDLNIFKKHGIPHIRPLPLLGNTASTLFRLQTGNDFIKSIYDLHSDAKYTGVYNLTSPTIVLRDTELLKSIALKHFDTFMDHPSYVREDQDPLMGKDLFSLRGDKWRTLRSLLTPAFTSSKMKNMFKLMSECGAEYGNYLAHVPREQQIMEIKDTFTRYTNDVIASCAFGIKVDSMRNPNNEFYIYGKEATNFGYVALLKIYMFKILPWVARILNMRLIRDEIANFFKDIVVTTIKTRDEKGIVRPDMLQLMMGSRTKEEKAGLTMDDMVSQAFSFFLGGFQSTATLMCFAAHEIAINQHVYERLQNEIDQVLKDTNGQISYEAVNNMEYLDAVINETLRMYPVAPIVDRLCLEDFELEPTLPGAKPYTVKKGESVWIPIYGFHHDPRYFEEPEKFDPERFIGERKRTTLSCGAYVPFGLGPRMCIGNRFALLETKVLLFHLLACCDLKICEKTSIPIKIATDGFNMKAEGGFWLKVVPRKNAHRTVTSDVANDD